MIRALFLLLLMPLAWADNVSLRFDSVRVDALAKSMFSEVIQRPYVIEDGIGKKTVSVQLQDVPRSSVALTLARVLEASDIEVREDSGIYFIGPRRSDELVIYRPRYRPVADLLELVRQAFPSASLMTGHSVGVTTETQDSEPVNGGDAVKPITRPQATTKAGGLGVLVLRLPPAQARAARELFPLVDTPAQQLYIRAVAYDVSTDKATGTSVDLALSLVGGKLGLQLSGGVLAKSAQAVTFKNATVDAVAKVLDSDSRFRTMSRPAVRVRSGGHARFSVGQEVPTLGGVTTNVGGATQAIVYRSAGVIFDVTPEVRDGGVDLEIKQTISSFQTTETSQLNSPTLNKRELETALTVRPGDVVVLAGLDSEEETGGGRSFFGIPLGRSQADTKRQTLLLLEVQAL